MALKVGRQLGADYILWGRTTCDASRWTSADRNDSAPGLNTSQTSSRQNDATIDPDNILGRTEVQYFPSLTTVVSERFYRPDNLTSIDHSSLLAVDLPQVSDAELSLTFVFAVGLNYLHLTNDWVGSRLMTKAFDSIPISRFAPGIQLLLAQAFLVLGDADNANHYVVRAVESLRGEHTVIEGISKAVLARVHALGGRLAEALQEQDEAIAILRPYPIDAEHADLVRVLLDKSIIFRHQRNSERAREALQEALDVLAKAGISDSPTAIPVLVGLSAICSDRQDYEAATEYCERIRAASERASGTNLAMASQNRICLGDVLLQKHDVYGALRNYEELLAMIGRAYGEMHPATAYVHLRMAAILLETDRRQATLDHAHRATSILEQIFGKSDLAVAPASLTLADAYRSAGDSKASLHYAERARAILESAFGNTDSRLGTSLRSISQAHLSLGESESALEVINRALENDAFEIGTENPAIAIDLMMTGEILLQKEKYPAALWNFRHALIIWRTIGDATHIAIGRCHSSIGRVYLLTGKYHEALSQFDAAEPLLKQALGAGHSEVGSVTLFASEALWGLGHRAEAVKKGRTAVDILSHSKDVGSSLAQVGPARIRLARMLSELSGRTPERARRRAGVVVSGCRSPACRRFELGDWLTKYENNAIENEPQFIDLTGAATGGSRVTVELVRDRKVLRIQVPSGDLGLECLKE